MIFKVLMSIAGQRRHFAQRHPTFGSRARPSDAANWNRSIYFWWWEFLRRSDTYKQTCLSKGRIGLTELFVDFGDVFEQTFKDWWNEDSRGARLFAEPLISEGVRRIGSVDEWPSEQDLIVVAIPLRLPKRYLFKRVRQLVGTFHTGRRGYQVAKTSAAKYRVTGKPNIAGLKTRLRVYDFWKRHPELHLWEIGNALPMFQMEHRIHPDDPLGSRVHKKNRLAATVSRYIRKAKASIKATEQGLSP